MGHGCRGGETIDGLRFDFVCGEHGRTYRVGPSVTRARCRPNGWFRPVTVRGGDRKRRVSLDRSCELSHTIVSRPFRFFFSKPLTPLSLPPPSSSLSLLFKHCYAVTTTFILIQPSLLRFSRRSWSASTDAKRTPKRQLKRDETSIVTDETSVGQ